MDRWHDDLHVLLASCGWTEGVVVFVVGRVFDAIVACGEPWGLEPIADDLDALRAVRGRR